LGRSRDGIGIDRQFRFRWLVRRLLVHHLFCHGFGRSAIFQRRFGKLRHGRLDQRLCLGRPGFGGPGQQCGRAHFGDQIFPACGHDRIAAVAPPAPPAAPAPAFRTLAARIIGRTVCAGFFRFAIGTDRLGFLHAALIVAAAPPTPAAPARPAVAGGCFFTIAFARRVGLGRLFCFFVQFAVDIVDVGGRGRRGESHHPRGLGGRRAADFDRGAPADQCVIGQNLDRNPVARLQFRQFGTLAVQHINSDLGVGAQCIARRAPLDRLVFKQPQRSKRRRRRCADQPGTVAHRADPGRGFQNAGAQPLPAHFEQTEC